MANDYFQFKQFTIYQDQCAMKVGTDGVLLGAWTDVNHANNMLDIGSGSGLISLMLAQRNTEANIIGIEIDVKACKQAKKNIADSIFADRVQIKNGDLKKIEFDNTFDLIVSNPPFFQNSTLSPLADRNLARHTESLHYEDLFLFAVKSLSINGRLSIITPTSETENIQALASNHKLYLERKTIVFPNEKKESKRTLFQFSRNQKETAEDSLILEKERHHYSSDALQLFKDFYLNA